VCARACVTLRVFASVCITAFEKDTRLCKLICEYVCVCAFVCACILVRVCVVCLSMCMCMCVCVCMCVRVCACVGVCGCVHVCVCTQCVCVRTWLLVYIHTFI